MGSRTRAVSICSKSFVSMSIRGIRVMSLLRFTEDAPGMVRTGAARMLSVIRGCRGGCECAGRARPVELVPDELSIDRNQLRMRGSEFAHHRAGDISSRDVG